jgi:hypothetical protein
MSEVPEGSEVFPLRFLRPLRALRVTLLLFLLTGLKNPRGPGIAQAHIDPPYRDVELACFGVVGRARLWKVWDSLFPPEGRRTPKRRRRGRRRFVKRELPEDPRRM